MGSRPQALPVFADLVPAIPLEPLGKHPLRELFLMAMWANCSHICVQND